MKKEGSSPSPKSAKPLVLCVHAHQPVGNFDHVFAEAFEKSYNPFFQVLEKHPSIPVSVHLSGSLVDWLEKERPDFIRSLKNMADRGQIEFLGGAYYEPIFGLIPSKDLLGQIECMRRKVLALFGQDPEGAWLTERVWDPGLTAFLARAGVAYTVLDDHHFEKIGERTPVTGYYRTRHFGRSVDLFASMKHLRYLMPFRRPEDTLEFIEAEKSAPGEVFVFADDLEKFGLWPGTYDWVYPHGWLDRFFTLLETSKTIRPTTFSSVRKNISPKKTVKVPHASYSEMMEWSGGRFYNFLKKYPESRYTRDRMWTVSRELEKLNNGNGTAAAFETARQFLYKAQCNCSYWHGVFGGLYLHHLRSAVFENLIKAEELILDAAAGHGLGERPQAIRKEKLDSGERWRVEGPRLTMFFNPRYGAAMEELDYRPLSVNLMCNLKRSREFYHEAVLNKNASTPGGEAAAFYQMLGMKEQGLEKELHYDKHSRLAFMDHIFQRPVSPKEFSGASYPEVGDFIGTPYRAENGPRISFIRRGRARIEGEKRPLSIRKTISPAGSKGAQVRYELKNTGRKPLDLVLGVEFNFSIGETQASKGLHRESVKEWVFHDPWRDLDIRLAADQASELIAGPIETISESESGLERTYQQLGVLLQKRFRLGPGLSNSYVLELEVGKHDNSKKDQN